MPELLLKTLKLTPSGQLLRPKANERSSAESDESSGNRGIHTSSI